MWHLIVSLFLVSSSVTLSAATAAPYQLRRQAPSADLKFTCPKTLSNALCCSNDLQSNGAVKDCQESRYVIPNPGSSHGELKDRCTTSQLGNGYDTPVCCNIKVRTFKFENGAPIFLGVNCMDAEHVSVGLEKREEPERIPTTTFDTSKFTRYSPLDHRREVPPTATLPLVYNPNKPQDVHADSAQTPQPLWRRRAAKKAARRSLKKRSAASKSKNSVANTIMNDLNSASSRAIVRNTGPKARSTTTRSQIANKPASAPKEVRQLPGVSSLGGLGSLTKLLGGLGKSGVKKVRQLPGVSSLGGLGSLTKLLGGLGGSSGVKQARQLPGLSSLGGLGSLTKLLGGLGGMGGNGNGTGTLARRAAMVGNVV